MGFRGSVRTLTKYEVHDRTDWRRIVSAAAIPQLSGSGEKNNQLLFLPETD